MIPRVYVDSATIKPDGPRVAIVFPPAMFPTSPPLGVASLKAYVASREIPCAMRVFDLNHSYFNQALQWLQDGRLKMSLGGKDSGETARKVAASCDLLRGRKGLEAFLDLDIYNGAASIYRSFGTVLNGLFENFARRILLDLPVPPLVQKYFQELVEPLRAFRPDLAGFSILFSQQLFFALALAKCLKESGTRVVLGGATLAVMPHPERLLSDPTPVLVGGASHPLDLSRYVDYLLIGEGEPGFAELVERFGGDVSGVPGLVHFQGERLISNAPEMINDLGRLPLPDFSDLPWEEYHSPEPLFPYLSSRGCFWGKCAFCTHPKTYLAYREEPVGSTVSRLEALRARYGVSHFNFVDEMIHPKRFARLSRGFIERGLEIAYSAYAKPTGRFSRSLLGSVYRSGGRVIMWGVESGNQRVLDAMGKGTHLEDMERLLADARDAGIWNLLFLLFGFPSETREEWEDTLRFLERHRDSIDALSKSSFVLLAGSEIIRHPQRYAITGILDRAERDPVSVAFDYAVSEGLSQKEVQKIYGEQAEILSCYGRSPHFGVFRDHLLLHASLGKRARES